ncbi:hypothetical protein K0U00_37110, partial [Paenibacillus sepulcri]|nr:hypothetical protein [Paenibacillus sepulcri]
MPILDTGMLLNRNHPNSITIAIRAVNRGRHHAVVGIQSYRFHSGSVRDEGEFGSEQVRTIRLVALAPAQQEESAFAISHTVQDLQSFGIRIVAGGPGGRDVAATAAELDADGNMLHIHPMPAVRTANRDEKGLAYVANHTQHSLTVIDTSTDTRIMTLPLNAGSSPRQVAITPD